MKEFIAGMSRREFGKRSALALAGAAAARVLPVGLAQAEAQRIPVAVFSKLYQELDLDFEASAALTADAGLDGVDCAVRPKGEVLPEKVAEDLPRYHEALRERGLGMPLITTGILSTSSTNAETLLRTAKKLGVTRYRLGWQHHDKNLSLTRQLAEVKAQLKDVADLNKQVGIGAIYQNHSPSGAQKYVGGDLTELQEIVGGFDPDEIGVAFDIAHAIVVHGDKWREHFERLKPHLRTVYVKDVKLPHTWVPLGKGDIYATGYFDVIKQLNYRAPVSLHVEYNWSEGQSKDRAGMLAALKRDTALVRRWLA